MSRMGKWFAICLTVGGIALLWLGALCYVAGARINTTRSIPVGLYWTSNQPVKKGAYVLFCPPDTVVFSQAKQRGYIGAGFCPGNYGYMMKRVVAMNKDEVTVSQDGVRVNGRLLPLSEPMERDGGGRVLLHHQTGRLVMSDSEWFLMSDVSRTSFDGRYFGPIQRSQIKSVIVPVVTW